MQYKNSTYDLAAQAITCSNHLLFRATATGARTDGREEVREV
jgi:hypothetical protein